MKNGKRGVTYHTLSSHVCVCNPQSFSMCFDKGEKKRARETHRHGEKYPEIQVSCEASAGVEGYTCQRPGASRSFSLALSFPLSSFCLSLSLLLSSWTCGASLPPSPPLPFTHPASRIQASSAQPCVAISGNSFRMLPVHCIHSSLSFPLSVTPLRVFLFTIRPSAHPCV